MDQAVAEAADRRQALADKGKPTSGYLKYDALHRGPGGNVPHHRIIEISQSGVVADPTGADPDLGSRVIRTAIERLAQVCLDLRPRPDRLPAAE